MDKIQEYNDSELNIPEEENSQITLNNIRSTRTRENSEGYTENICQENTTNNSNSSVGNDSEINSHDEVNSQVILDSIRSTRNRKKKEVNITNTCLEKATSNSNGSVENQPFEKELEETNTWVTLDNIEPTSDQSKETENSCQNKSLENLNNTLDNPHPEQKPEEERVCPCGNKYPPIFIKNKPKPSIDDWIECETCKTWFHQHCAGTIQKSGETISSQSFVCGPCLTKQVEALQNSLKNLKQNSCLNFENKSKNNIYKTKPKKAERTYQETKTPAVENNTRIVVIDGVTKSFNSSTKIKQELSKFSKFKEIDVKHCYQLVRGGIAIHVQDEKSEQTLLGEWPSGAFGAQNKLKSHRPSFHNKKSIVVKQVDPNTNHLDIAANLKEKHDDQEIHIRRFYKNRSPLPVIKVTAKTELINCWLQEGIEIFDQSKPCEPYRYRYIPTRCYKCQRFGHTSKICHRLPRCAKCGKDHPTLECEETNFHCVNCKENHPSYDPKCQAFLNRQRKGEERKQKELIFFSQNNTDQK